MPSVELEIYYFIKVATEMAKREEKKTEFDTRKKHKSQSVVLTRVVDS